MCLQVCLYFVEDVECLAVVRPYAVSCFFNKEKLGDLLCRILKEIETFRLDTVKLFFCNLFFW